MARWKQTRPFRLGSAAMLAIALVVAGTGAAATINGTAANDTLRGSASGDKLTGKGGNDKLYGLAGDDALTGGPGNDMLVGGPGADRLACGPGRDRARGDADDKIGKDCEVVTGVRSPTPPPPPPPPPPPTPPPPPPPPPPAQAIAGKYCGFTNSGGGICFDIGHNGSANVFTKARFEQTTDCSPDGRFRLTITFGGQVPLTSDLRFTYAVASGDLAGSRIDGSVDTQGNAKGSLLMKASIDHEGTRYACESSTDWTATLQR